MSSNLGEIISNSSSWTTTSVMPREQAIERFGVAAGTMRQWVDEVPRYVGGIDLATQPVSTASTGTAVFRGTNPDGSSFFSAFDDTLMWGPNTSQHPAPNGIWHQYMHNPRTTYNMQTGREGMEAFRQAIDASAARHREESTPAPVLDKEYRVTISATKLTVESDDEMFFLDVHDANKNLRRFKSEVNGFFRDKEIPFKLTVFNGE